MSDLYKLADMADQFSKIEEYSIIKTTVKNLLKKFEAKISNEISVDLDKEFASLDKEVDSLFIYLLSYHIKESEEDLRLLQGIFDNRLKRKVKEKGISNNG